MALITGLFVAVIAGVAAILPAAAAVRAEQTSRISSIHRAARVNIAVSTTTPFRSRTLAPPASAPTSSFRDQMRAQPTSD
jgi:hypothetical protein